MTNYYDAGVQAFFECAKTALEIGDFTLADGKLTHVAITLDDAIDHAWRMSIGQLSCAIQRDGEARFRRWHAAHHAVLGIEGRA